MMTPAIIDLGQLGDGKARRLRTVLADLILPLPAGERSLVLPTQRRGRASLGR